jgi:hypothetical protein
VKNWLTGWILAAGLLGSVLPAPGGLWAQEEKRLTLAVSAGAGAVQTRGRAGSWDFGPFFGSRVEWGNRRSGVALGIDIQPFRAEGTTSAGDFRAIYLLPSYIIGSGSRRVRIGIGLGVFDFSGGDEAGTPFLDGTEVGMVGGASGSMGLGRSFSIELGWKRINNVQGLRANVWSLQLVRSWRL